MQAKRKTIQTQPVKKTYGMVRLKADTYEVIKQMAEDEGRTIQGQVKIILAKYLSVFASPRS